MFSRSIEGLGIPNMYGMMVIVTLADLVLNEEVNAFFLKENTFSVSKFPIQTQLIEESLIKHYVLDI